MDPHKFLSGMFQMAGLYHLAAHVEGTCGAVGRDALPDAGKAAWDKAEGAGEDPAAYQHEKGLVVIARWEDEEAIRLVCWAEAGEDEWGQFTNQWWTENNPALKGQEETAG